MRTYQIIRITSSLREVVVRIILKIHDTVPIITVGPSSKRKKAVLGVSGINNEQYSLLPGTVPGNREARAGAYYEYEFLLFIHTRIIPGTRYCTSYCAIWPILYFYSEQVFRPVEIVWKRVERGGQKKGLAHFRGNFVRRLKPYSMISLIAIQTNNIDHRAIGP